MNYDIMNMPPPPPAGRYVWIKTKEGGYWRTKRCSNRPARLNEAYQQGCSAMKISAPAASRIMRRLSPYLSRLDTGRLNARISARLRKALKEGGRLTFTY